MKTLENTRKRRRRAAVPKTSENFSARNAGGSFEVDVQPRHSRAAAVAAATAATAGPRPRRGRYNENLLDVLLRSAVRFIKKNIPTSFSDSPLHPTGCIW